MSGMRFRWFFLALVVWLMAAGCSKTRTIAAKPLAPEQVAPTMEAAFKDAPPGVKEAANDAISAIQNKDEARALAHFQNLSVQSDLTADQRSAAARSMMSVLAQLQMAAANGNKAAEDILQKYRATK